MHVCCLSQSIAWNLIVDQTYMFGLMVRVWDYLAMVILCRRSRLSRGTIDIVGVFHPVRQLARFSPLNMPYILNLFRISLCRKAINYRPYTSLSFEVVSHIKNCHFSHYYYHQGISPKLKTDYIASPIMLEFA